MFVTLLDSDALHYVLDTYELFNSTQTVYCLMNLSTSKEYSVLGKDKLKEFEFDCSGASRQIIQDLGTMCRTKHEFQTGRISQLNLGWFIEYQGQSFLIVVLEEVEEDYILAQAANVMLSEVVQFRQFFYRDIRFPSDDYGIKFMKSKDDCSQSSKRC